MKTGGVIAYVYVWLERSYDPQKDAYTFVIHILSCLQYLSPQCQFSLYGAALGVYGAMVLLYGVSMDKAAAAKVCL